MTHEQPRRRSIEEWVSYIDKTDIPILKQTQKELLLLKKDEDDLSPREISAAVLNDPMMVFRVLSYSQKNKGRHQVQDLLEVEQAVIMMGTSIFFNRLAPRKIVNDMLGQDLKALTELLKLIKRAHRASYFATEFAVYHKDMHSEEIHVAALLHDLSEMLMWCFAPTEMNQIRHIQSLNKSYRSADVQEKVLGFPLHDLQNALVAHFGLPPLLSKLMDDDFADDKRVKHVILAVNFARHSANGWDDAALPDDYEAIANFLRIGVERTKRVLGAPTTNASNVIESSS